MFAVSSNHVTRSLLRTQLLQGGLKDSGQSLCLEETRSRDNNEILNNTCLKSDKK